MFDFQSFFTEAEWRHLTKMGNITGNSPEEYLKDLVVDDMAAQPDEWEPTMGPKKSVAERAAIELTESDRRWAAITGGMSLFDE